MSSDGRNQPGLVITVTESIRLFLLSASNDPCLSQELRELALTLSSRTNASYKQIRSIWIGSDVDTRPGLISLLSGSNFVFVSPKPREKSEELKERLRKLKEIAERKEYQELVKDITPKKDLNEPFSNYKDQIGFGLHVALMMFTGYLVGYFAFRALFNHSPVMNSAGGILGLVFGMLLETLLFIIRTSDSKLESPSSTSRSKKINRVAKKRYLSSVEYCLFMGLRGLAKKSVVSGERALKSQGLILVKVKEHCVLNELLGSAGIMKPGGILRRR